MKISKNLKVSKSKINRDIFYSLKEASSLVKEVSTTKFDSSIDVAIKLGVDPKKSNEMVRGVVNLPHGTGKKIRVLALVPADKENDAREAGADMVGLDEYLQKIKDGWTDIDVIITMPSIMGKLGPLGKVLGPRGLMPNPKTGTVTMDIKKAIIDIKGGKIDFKVDKAGIIHACVGKSSFTSEKIHQNLDEFLKTVVKLKPSSTKGEYVKSIFVSSTMSPSIPIDLKEVSI
tara:strand:- start:1137 stop:1829 length:693 start_codon:yes stop_codon:yes gene_type:complete